MKRITALAALMLASADPTAAQIGGTPTHDSLTAVALYSACTHPPGETSDVHEFAEQTCAAYMRGMTDGLWVSQTFREKGRISCFPTDTPIGNDDARRIFTTWLKNHPEAAKNSAAIIVAYALTAAYPCRKLN
jgi:hypothetical protein